MPAYNEAQNITQNLRETVETLRGFGGDYEIIVVDDGSHDRTWLAAITHLRDYNGKVRIVRHEQNRGKGNALICGVWYAQGDVIVFLDADMDLHPSQLPTFFAIMEAQAADVVIGSKLHPGSKVNYPFARRVLSLGYSTIVRLLFGLPVRDTQTGLKVFKAEVVRRVFPKVLAKRFAFDIKVLAIAHHLGYRIAGAPVTLNFTRRFGRVGMGDVHAIFNDTLAIFYRSYIRRYYDSITAEWAEPTFERRIYDQPLIAAGQDGLADG